jgi:hypothetical protein
MYSSQFLTILMFLTTVFYGCGFKNDKVDKIITNPRLLASLTDVINHEDSLSITHATYGVIKSFKITFSEENNKCFVSIVGDFDYYDSHAMNGYFIYKNKTVTVYGITSNCGNNFISKSKLKIGKIEGLKDFDYEEFQNAIRLQIPPPPPPPPSEPYYRKYLIVDKDNFLIVEDYDKLK